MSVGTDRRLIDFEETRFRIHSLRLQKTLKSLAADLAADLGITISSLEDLTVEDSSVLQDGTYCVFDFLDVKYRRSGGFIGVKWIPIAVFVNGERVFSLHAHYNGNGSNLVGITMRRENEDEYTSCTTLKSATKVGRSYLRIYFPRKS